MVDSETRPQVERELHLLGLLLCVSAMIYGWISWLSWQFEYDSLPQERPILLALGLFGILFLIYLVGIRILRRVADDRRCFRVIIVGSLLFRLTMLFSVPILEIDIYRYIWDGAATSSGVSPFRFPPEIVKNADSVVDDPSLQRLVNMRDHQPALAEVLNRIHFAELPTVYPTASQVVFSLANITSPEQASVQTRLLVMKAWLLAFDLGTLWLVIKLLRIAGRSPSLSIVYGWCPLLIKEVANSGHLDAIAVFFTTLTVFLVAKCLVRARNGAAVPWSVCLAVVISFALAVGAKLYPIVLAPILAGVALRKTGVRRSLIWGGVCVLLIGILLLPLAYQGTSANDPSEGLRTFVNRWEMNDFLFLITVENLRPDDGRGPHALPWFTVLPDRWRTSLAKVASPFTIARGITVTVFLLIAARIARSVARDPGSSNDQVSAWVRGSFLTLAWFWLLAPTQNPWYWTWALPFLPFAKSRAWLLVSGIVFAYYLRFWFTDHFSNSAVLGTRYAGPAFYDFVVTWIEFFPWLLFLSFTWASHRASMKRYGGLAPQDEKHQAIGSVFDPPRSSLHPSVAREEL